MKSDQDRQEIFLLRAWKKITANATVYSGTSHTTLPWWDWPLRAGVLAAVSVAGALAGAVQVRMEWARGAGVVCAHREARCLAGYPGAAVTATMLPCLSSQGTAPKCLLLQGIC